VSKPLKLTIHPRLEDTNLSAHDIHQGRLTTLRLAQAKRLTDAELAAEYWAPIFIHFPDPTVWDRDYEGTSAEMSRRSATLHRFATSPHYFEADQ
jgi:hypothetical protein